MKERNKMVNLYHGDSFEVMKKIPNNSIDLLIADPHIT